MTEELDFATTIRLTFNNKNKTSIVEWDEYTFTSDFLVPCDAFTVHISSAQPPDIQNNILNDLFTDYRSELALFKGFSVDTTGSPSVPAPMEPTIFSVLAGSQVKLELVFKSLKSKPLMVGYVDQIEIQNSREGGGTIYIVRGRNLLSSLCDSGIDPVSNAYKFVEGQKLSDVLGKIFSDFNIDSFWLTDAVNREVVTGNNSKTTKTITKTTVTEIPTDLLNSDITASSSLTTVTTNTVQHIDPTNNFDLSEKDIKKLQPKFNQTFMQFVEEHLARFHLHCWAMANGDGIVIGTPDYSSDNYLGQQIINKRSGSSNNVKHGELFLDYFSQPSLIIAAGKQGGGDNAYVRVRVAKINEFLGFNSDFSIIDSVNNSINKFKGLVPLKLSDLGRTLVSNYSYYFTKPIVPRALYLEHSDTATTHELEGIVNRKMAEFQKKAITLKYTLQGHDYQGIPWKHNTLVNIDDEILNVHGQFWLQTVTYRKSRSSGTLSELALIPIGTLQL